MLENIISGLIFGLVLVSFMSAKAAVTQPGPFWKNFCEAWPHVLRVVSALAGGIILGGAICMIVASPSSQQAYGPRE